MKNKKIFIILSVTLIIIGVTLFIIVRNYDVKAKVIYKYNRLYNIEIIDMDSNDLNEINNTDFITKLLNTNSLDDIEHLNKSSDKLVELIKKLEDEK